MFHETAVKLLKEFRPNVGAATCEPSVYEMAVAYYSPWFTKERSHDLASEFVDRVAQEISDHR